jgi:hypothetical protein
VICGGAKYENREFSTVIGEGSQLFTFSSAHGFANRVARNAVRESHRVARFCGEVITGSDECKSILRAGASWRGLRACVAW